MSELTLEDIIDALKDCSFPDLGASRPFLAKLWRTQLPDQTTPLKDIREIMMQELRVLRVKIDDHFAGEFMVLPGRDGTDNKLGHWNSLHWIMAKWFQNARAAEDVPQWYLRCAKRVPQDVDRGQEYCSKVVDDLIAILQNAEEETTK